MEKYSVESVGSLTVHAHIADLIPLSMKIIKTKQNL